MNSKTDQKRKSKPWLKILMFGFLGIVVIGVGLYIWQVLSIPEVDQSLVKTADIDSSGANPQKSTDENRKGSITDLFIDFPIDKTEHPLDTVIKVAEKGLAEIDTKVKDYTATIEKQELVKQKLLPKEYLQCKIRHQQGDIPFAVYLHFVAPKALNGQEAIWVKGENDNKFFGHKGGLMAKLPVVPIPTDHFLAMKGNRYPITEIGIRNLVARMIEVAHKDRKHGEIEIKIDRNITVNGNSATLIELTHPKRRDHFSYHKAKIYIDDVLNLPVGYQGYMWPKTEGGEPQLLESYFYNDLKLNVGLKDSDFDPKNPAYNFNY